MDWHTFLFKEMRKIKTWMNKRTLRTLRQEHGAVFVLTAILLPVLCGFMGIAYDVGNLYMHKAKLQNVTDAAALAGGAVFKERSDQKTDEKSGTRINLIPNNHKLADDAATTFIDKNKIDLGSNIVIDELSALPGSKSTVPSDNDNVTIEKQNIYYRVIASDTVPLYFLPVIMSNTHDQLVRTASVALVETTTRTTTSGGGGSSDQNKTILDNLFTFSGNLNLVQIFENPDLTAMTKTAPNYLNTFDGAVVFTNSMNITEQINSNAEALRYMLPASGAKGFQKTFFEIIDAYTTYAEKMDIDFAAEKYQNIFTKKFTSAANAGTRVELFDKQRSQIQSNYLNSQIAKGKNIFTFNNPEHNNGDLQISNPLNGNSEEPIFLMYDKDQQIIHISTSVDTVRPIVVVYLGTNTIQFTNSRNGTFRGIIYAPNTLVNLQNSENFKFYGNIIAKNIDIQGAKNVEFHLVNYLKDDPDFKDMPVYTHHTGSVTQAVYDATFKDALRELANGTSNININGWENSQRQQQLLARAYELLYNSNGNPTDIINDPNIILNADSSSWSGDTLVKLSKADLLRVWYYAYESTLNKLMSKYGDDFQLSDLNFIDKVSWDNDVPSSGGGGGGNGETTVTKSSTLRLINPREEQPNPYFSESDDI